MLLACTSPGDIVLDPFLGTGTTAAVAQRLRRHFIGIERHPAYVEAALGRRAAVDPRRDGGCAATPSQARRAARAVRQPGGARPGRAGHGADGPHAPGACGGGGGRVDPVPARSQGSIHKVGAEVQNAPACNGWTFWHIEREGELVPIDALRKEPSDN